MPIEFQLIIYFLTGIILTYILFLRKKIIESFSTIILYIGLGFLFFSGENNLYEYIGITIIFFSVIVGFIQYYISYKKKN